MKTLISLAGGHGFGGLEVLVSPDYKFFTIHLGNNSGGR